MTSRARVPSVVAAVAVAALPFAACGSDDGGGGGGGKPPGQVIAAGDPAKGEEVFAQNCAVCHGSDGGGGTGPKLAHESKYADADVVVPQVRGGGGGMPAFADQLSEQELADVTSFVVKRMAR